MLNSRRSRQRYPKILVQKEHFYRRLRGNLLVHYISVSVVTIRLPTWPPLTRNHHHQIARPFPGKPRSLGRRPFSNNTHTRQAAYQKQSASTPSIPVSCSTSPVSHSTSRGCALVPGFKESDGACRDRQSSLSPEKDPVERKPAFTIPDLQRSMPPARAASHVQRRKN